MKNRIDFHTARKYKQYSAFKPIEFDGFKVWAQTTAQFHVRRCFHGRLPLLTPPQISNSTPVLFAFVTINDIVTSNELLESPEILRVELFHCRAAAMIAWVRFVSNDGGGIAALCCAESRAKENVFELDFSMTL